ncbi:MAG: histidinol-phosphate transaminase [Bacteroidales bacterium]|nr:histidinol-phosphate transaminase [Bacteroidales bacterium]
MTKLKNIIRPDLLTMKPYSSARNEFTGRARIFLDANENPYGSSFRGVTGMNRYPDPMQYELKERITRITGIQSDRIIIGNGSDEILDLLVRATTMPGRSNVITVPPTYGMYRVVAETNNVAVKEVLPGDDFMFSADEIMKAVDKDTRIIFICSPNNPTGILAPSEEVNRIVEQLDGLVVIDEAYIDFSGTEGFLQLIKDYENIFILRTFSKARAMAGARLGMGYGHPELLRVLNSIKMPYNVNSLTLAAGLNALDREEIYRSQVQRIISNREKLTGELGKIDGIRKVFPSSANFILVRVDKPVELYNYLLAEGIVVRDRSGMPLCEGCLRITVGTENQNRILVEEINNFFAGKPAGEQTDNQVVKRRRTRETDILVDINLRGRGIADIQTGSGFLDHMLELFAFHSKTDLLVRASGDIDVDMHHTVEDIAITMGQALNEMLGDRKGVNRYGFVMPMDESRAMVTIDIGGRNMLVWNVKFHDNTVGRVPASLFKHFFRSLADNAGFTLNIEAEGEDDHHIIEAVFKGFARSLKQAAEITDDRIQSTKY